jgi:hypothetical protein
MNRDQNFTGKVDVIREFLNNLGGGPRCLDSLMGGISSDSVGFFLVKHQAASANG